MQLEPRDGSEAQTGAAAVPLKVLVVDDNEDAADALAAVTRLLGHEVQARYSGSAALAAVAADVPDVMLLDLCMPEMDGLEVATRARALAGGRAVLLVATTALGEWDARAATALAGFHFHLIKPIKMDTLRMALDQFKSVRASLLPRPNLRIYSSALLADDESHDSD